MEVHQNSVCVCVWGVTLRVVLEQIQKLREGFAGREAWRAPNGALVVSGGPGDNAVTFWGKDFAPAEHRTTEVLFVFK